MTGETSQGSGDVRRGFCLFFSSGSGLREDKGLREIWTGDNSLGSEDVDWRDDWHSSGEGSGGMAIWKDNLFLGKGKWRDLILVTCCTYVLLACYTGYTGGVLRGSGDDYAPLPFIHALITPETESKKELTKNKTKQNKKDSQQRSCSYTIFALSEAYFFRKRERERERPTVHPKNKTKKHAKNVFF